LWASNQYSGIPYFANPTHGIFQPLNLLFLFVPISTGLALHAFLGLLLMGLFSALYLRALGAGYIAATIGGMAYAFGGASAATMSRPQLLGVLAWTPLLYWIIFEHANTPRGIHVVLGGVVMAFMVFAGTPMLALLLAGSAFTYGIARAVWHRKSDDIRLSQKLSALGLMALLGATLSAVQWVPYGAWLATLAHPAEALWPWNWAGHVPAAPKALAAAFLLPGDGTLPEMLYVGVISLILIPAALLQQRGRFEVVFFSLAATLWISAAVWKLDGTATTETWKVLVFPGVFSLAVMTGLGADRLLLAGRDPRSPLIWGSALLVILAAAITLVLGPPDARGWILAALVVLLPFFLLRVTWMGVLCGTLLVFLLFANLRDASKNIYQHPYTGDVNWLEDSLPALREAQALSLGERILTLPAARQTTLPENAGLLLGINNAHGAHWPLSVGQARWWDHLAPYLSPMQTTATATPDEKIFYPALLNYMGVRIVIGEHNLPWMDAPPGENGISLEFHRTMGGLSLWRNTTALPRVRLLHRWRPVIDEEAALAALLDPDFPGDTTCVVEAQGRGWRTLSKTLPHVNSNDAAVESGAGRCVVQSEMPESLVIDVDTDDAGILVVADTYAPGWRAYVDGKRAPLVKVNGLFRGVLVSPGTHVVQFSYAPMSVTLGLLVSVGALAACLLWMLRAGVRWLL
ncbi:MAG: YfhO family protein, partial [Candidatus Hydrogenedentes bacterium]|nr:YfhO family protein [Candidatus Hydrogenedentota bacterium]